jgi:hypothetical protein
MTILQLPPDSALARDLAAHNQPNMQVVIDAKLSPEFPFKVRIVDRDGSRK